MAQVPSGKSTFCFNHFWKLHFDISKLGFFSHDYPFKSCTCILDAFSWISPGRNFWYVFALARRAPKQIPPALSGKKVQIWIFWLDSFSLVVHCLTSLCTRKKKNKPHSYNFLHLYFLFANEALLLDVPLNSKLPLTWDKTAAGALLDQPLLRPVTDVFTVHCNQQRLKQEICHLNLCRKRSGFFPLIYSR